MKYLAVCLLILYASLISAELDILDETIKSNLFAPLNDEVRPILFMGADIFENTTINKIAELSLSEQISLLSQLRHSYSEIDISSLNFTLQEIDWRGSIYFYEELLNFIDLVTDTEILYNTSIQYYQEIKETSHIDSQHSLKYENYLRFTEGSISNFDRKVARDIEKNTLQEKSRDFIKILYKIIQQNICSLQTSPQQAIGNFLGHVGLYIVQIQLTHYLNTRIHEKIKEHYQWDISLFNDKKGLYKYYSEFYKRAQKGLMGSQEFSPCLPLNPVKGSTYVILKNPFKDFTSEELEAKCHLFPRTYCNHLNKNADRYINLEPVYSNIYNNSVITGIRFVEKNHILHIQIQQGQLLKNGNVNSKTVAWVPIDDNITCGSTNDCYLLNHAGPHVIDLGDSLINPYGSEVKKVLTGIRLTDENNYGRLRLQIYGTPFNFAEGKLITDVKENTQVPEGKKYKVQDSVTLTTSTVNGGPEKMSPYIDIQPVETRLPAAMVGAGIYTRTINGNKLLSLKLFTYDIGLFVKGVVSPIK